MTQLAKRFIPFIAYLATQLFTSSAFALTLDKQHHLQLHGYLQRIGISEVKDDDLRFKDRLIGDYTEAALNLNWQPKSRIQLIGDVHYQSLSQEKNPTTLNILSLSYELYSASWGNVTLSGGRLKNTLVGLNSAQDSPLSRETTDYARTYLGNMVQAFDSIDGGHLATQWQTDAGDSFQAHLYLGKMQTNNFGSPKLATNMSLTIKDYRLNGLKLQWEPYHMPGLLLASSFVQVDSNSEAQIETPFNTQRLPIDTQINVAILMARYEWGNWRVSSELAQAQLNFQFLGQHLEEQMPAWYLSLVWQPPGPWTTTLRYESTDYSNISQKLTANLPSQTNTAPLQGKTYQGLIGYVRYQFNRTLYAGLEIDWLHRHPNETQETVALAQIGVHF